MEPLLLDLALSRRIELAEAKAAVAGAQVMQRLLPELGAAVEEIAGGYAVFAGANSPVTQALGLGLNGEVSEAEFGRLETFYRERNESVRVETSPLADPSLFKLFGTHGYAVTEFTNVMARKIDGREDSPVMDPLVRVECVSSSEIDTWNFTVAQGFRGTGPVSKEILDVMKMFALAEGHECYLARIDGLPAGGATLAIRGGIAGLFGASTLLAFRKCGVQSALLAARLARGAEAGCDLAVCLAQPGSSSQRNIVRQGFVTLYTRIKFERH